MDRGKWSQKSSSKYWCVVPGCTSDSRKKTNLEKYPWMENVTFIPFQTNSPPMTTVRQSWSLSCLSSNDSLSASKFISEAASANFISCSLRYKDVWMPLSLTNSLSSGTDFNFGCSVAILNKRCLDYSHVVMEVTWLYYLNTSIPEQTNAMHMLNIHSVSVANLD